MKASSHDGIENRLMLIADELEQQELGSDGWFPPGAKTLADEVAQIKQHIVDGGEYGIAYESLVCVIEAAPIKLTGKPEGCTVGS